MAFAPSLPASSRILSIICDSFVSVSSPDAPDAPDARRSETRSQVGAIEWPGRTT